MRRLSWLLVLLSLVGCGQTEIVTRTVVVPVTATPESTADFSNLFPVPTATPEVRPEVTEPPLELPENADSTQEVETELPGVLIDDLILEAAADEVITLEAGVYKVSECLLVEKPLTIRGAGSERTTILASQGGCVFNFIGEAEDQLQLEGIGFHYSQFGIGSDTVLIEGMSFAVKDVDFFGSRTLGNYKADLHAGLRISNAVGEIAGSVFGDNYWGAGVLAENGAEVEISGSLFYGGTTGNRYGVVVFDTSKVTITTSQIYAHSVGILVEDQGQLTVISVRGKLNHAAIAFFDDSKGKIVSSVFVDNKMAGVLAFGHSVVEIKGSQFGQNQYGVDVRQWAEVVLSSDNIFYNNYADINQQIYVVPGAVPTQKPPK